MDVASGFSFLLSALIFLVVVVGVPAAIVLALRALMQSASALQRIAAALEKRPPS